jgi:hypothetical protein
MRRSYSEDHTRVPSLARQACGRIGQSPERARHLAESARIKYRKIFSRIILSGRGILPGRRNGDGASFMLGRYLRFARFEFLYPIPRVIAIARVVATEERQSPGLRSWTEQPAVTCPGGEMKPPNWQRQGKLPGVTTASKRAGSYYRHENVKEQTTCVRFQCRHSSATAGPAPVERMFGHYRHGDHLILENIPPARQAGREGCFHTVAAQAACCSGQTSRRPAQGRAGRRIQA